MDILTFIVLIPIIYNDAREISERISERKFATGTRAVDIHLTLKEEFNIEAEVYSMSGFMDDFNDEQIEQSDYFLTYVFS